MRKNLAKSLKQCDNFIEFFCETTKLAGRKPGNAEKILEYDTDLSPFAHWMQPGGANHQS